MDQHTWTTFEMISVTSITIAGICSLLLIFLISKNREVWSKMHFTVLNLEIVNAVGIVFAVMSWKLNDQDDINSFISFVDLLLKCNYYLLAAILVCNPRFIRTDYIFIITIFGVVFSVCFAFVIVDYADARKAPIIYLIFGIVLLAMMLIWKEIGFLWELEEDESRMRMALSRIYVINIVIGYIGIVLRYFRDVHYVLHTDYLTSLYVFLFLMMANDKFRMVFT